MASKKRIVSRMSVKNNHSNLAPRTISSDYLWGDSYDSISGAELTAIKRSLSLKTLWTYPRVRVSGGRPYPKSYPGLGLRQHRWNREEACFVSGFLHFEGRLQWRT